MKFTKCVELALKNILSNRTRSLLTMLGIIIGIMSVISLVSLMNGVTGKVTDMFDELGTTSINVVVQPRGSSRQVKAEDMYEIAGDNPQLFAGVTPKVTVNATVKTGDNSDSLSSSVTGVSEVYAEMTKTEIDQGDFFTYVDVDRMQKVCVIGTYVQSYLFGQTSALGQKIKLNGDAYTVVGVCAEKAESAKGSSDDCIYIPYTNAMRINKSTRISSYTLFATSEEAVDEATDIVDSQLIKILGDSDYFTIISMKEVRDKLNDVTDLLTWALVFIAGISLLVGGIGIMNIMLVTVTERTKEIGIRKALGTKRRDIMNQFVIEAATLSGIGGIIGILAGIGLSKIVGMVASIDATPSIGAMLLSFGVSAAIGIGFGYLPAKRAAALNPIDALRFE